MPLTPEIPLYNVVANFDGDSFPTLNDDTGPRPLADAIEDAEFYAANTRGDQYYTVEPAADTGPRYRVALVSADGERLLESGFDPLCGVEGNARNVGSSWADVTRAYHEAVGGDARCGRGLADQLVYRVVRV